MGYHAEETRAEQHRNRPKLPHVPLLPVLPAGRPAGALLPLFLGSGSSSSSSAGPGPLAAAEPNKQRLQGRAAGGGRREEGKGGRALPAPLRRARPPGPPGKDPGMGAAAPRCRRSPGAARARTGQDRAPQGSPERSPPPPKPPPAPQSGSLGAALAPRCRCRSRCPPLTSPRSSASSGAALAGALNAPPPPLCSRPGR